MLTTGNLTIGLFVVDNNLLASFRNRRVFLFKMRFRCAERHKEYCRRYNQAHPDRMAKWRAAKREKTGQLPRPRGGQRKRRPNFYSNPPEQNRQQIERQDGSFILMPDPAADDSFLLRKSGIHGLGLLTVDGASKDDVLLEYHGEVITMAEADVREAQYQAEKLNIYFFEREDGMVIDATRQGNLARFINHRCEPNCEAVSVGNQILIVALQNLPKGRELTIDYQLKTGENIPCNCRSAECSGSL